MEEKKLLVIIPAFNEEKNILNTIRNLHDNCSYDYVVINDGSKDDTELVLKQNNINFISHKINKGLSESLRTGMQYALDHGYDYAIQIDGDNQHDPKDIKNFFLLAKSPDIIVIGNRFNGEKQKLSLKILAQRYISFWFKLRTGIKLYDPTNGMRLYGKSFMEHYVSNINLMVEPSSIAYLVKKYHLKIVQAHTNVKEREHGESMYNKRWKQLKYILKETTRMCFINGSWTKKNKKEVR